MVIDESLVRHSTSNIELLIFELEQRKQGQVQETINNIVLKYGRNKRHLMETMKLLGAEGIIKVTEIGEWQYNGTEE